MPVKWGYTFDDENYYGGYDTIEEAVAEATSSEIGGLMFRCEKCGHYCVKDICSCVPYEVSLEGEDDSTIVHELCEDTAAERFCRDLDEGSGEEAEPERIVTVRHQEKEWKISVHAEYDVSYYSHEI